MVYLFTIRTFTPGFNLRLSLSHSLPFFHLLDYEGDTDEPVELSHLFSFLRPRSVDRRHWSPFNGLETHDAQSLQIFPQWLSWVVCPDNTINLFDYKNFENPVRDHISFIIQQYYFLPKSKNGHWSVLFLFLDKSRLSFNRFKKS